MVWTLGFSWGVLVTLEGAGGCRSSSTYTEFFLKLLLTEDNNGMKYLVVIVHGAASWVHAYPTMKKEARIVVGCVSMFIAAYGRADEVRCDAALELTGGDMVDVCAMFHMRHVPTLKESPQSHGTEAHVKRVAAAFRSLCVARPVTRENWSDPRNIAQVMFTLNTLPAAGSDI